ncbi:MAG: glycosyltransferase family 4 protein [Selenomonadales bacterium]|nr:glycosyltransferase family 4 protein [Selenomonadales bacterium]
MKRRVLFIASVYHHLASFHVPFMQLLQREGFEVHAAAAYGHRQCDLLAIGVQCWDVPFARTPCSLGSGRAFLRLLALMRTQHFDLIHVHTPIAAFLGRLTAKLTGQGKVLYTAHGFHFYSGSPWYNWLIYYTAELIAAHWTDGLITINIEDFDRAKKMGFWPNVNLFFVPGVGVDVQAFRGHDIARQYVRGECGIAEDDVVVTCVAELNENKNQSFLLDAWSECVRQHARTHLWLVGSGGQENELRRKVQRENIANVHFLGYRTDVVQILHESDIVTLVSKREGLPRCIMEAMAAGKPVVATDIRGNRDLVVNGETGLLVGLQDSNGLARAFAILINNKGTRNAMGSAGLSRVKEFDLGCVMEHMSAIYQSYLQVDKHQ